MASRGYSKRMLGSTRMPMRNVGGVKAPSFGINKKVSGLASTNRDEGTVGQGGVEVGGLPAGKSLARPGRKMFAHGGKVDHFEYGGMRERTAAERMKDWDKPIRAHETSMAQHKAGGGAVVDLDGRGASTKKHHASGKQMEGLSHSTPEQPIPRPMPKGRGRPSLEAPLPEGSDSDRGQYKGGGPVYGKQESALYQGDKSPHNARTDGGMTKDYHRSSDAADEGKKHGGAVEHHHDDDDDGYKHGGKLTAAARKHISPKNFALPGRRYPIEDASHARNALARVSQHGSSEEKATVRAAVHRKYPGIGSDD